MCIGCLFRVLSIVAVVVGVVFGGCGCAGDGSAGGDYFVVVYCGCHLCWWG